MIGGYVLDHSVDRNLTDIVRHRRNITIWDHTRHTGDGDERPNITLVALIDQQWREVFSCIVTAQVINVRHPLEIVVLDNAYW